MKTFSRRSFVRYFALLSVGASGLGKQLTRSVLAEVQPASDGGVLRLRLRDFPALQQEFGSVRVGSSPIAPNHTPTGLFYPVIIIRGSGARFYALDAACTHEGCTVPIYDPSAGYMQCPCHGSQYLIDGTVRRGPANLPLRQFPVHFDGSDALAVEIPDVSFSLIAGRVREHSERMRLEFVALEQLEYEIWFRRTPKADWDGPVAFALGIDQPADQTVVVGQPHIASVFLDASSSQGLYAVVLRVKQV